MSQPSNPSGRFHAPSLPLMFNDKMRTATPDPDVVNEIVAQWKDQDFDIKSLCLAIPNQRGDIEGVSRCAHGLRESYLEKAATLYRSVDAAIDAMDRTVASMVYAHDWPSDEELNELEVWDIANYTVELGVDPQGEPVLFDFAKTPHLYGVHTSAGLSRLTRNIVSQLPEAVFVFLGCPRTTPCNLAVPPARTKAEMEACIEWLHTELDQRNRMMRLHDLDSYPLFVIADPRNNHWLYDSDGLGLFADTCDYYNMHLVVLSDPAFLSLTTRAKDATLLTLMDCTEGRCGVVFNEGSFNDLYRLLTKEQFDTWLSRLESPEKDRHAEFWGLPVYKDLGIPFTNTGRNYEEVLELDESYREQRSEDRHFSHRMLWSMSQ